MTDTLRDLRARILKELRAGGPELGDEDIAYVLAPVMRDYAAEHLSAATSASRQVGGATQEEPFSM